MAGMDPTAALLANRTDCGYDSELNFDALLLGGYYCHVCLPVNNGSMCDPGGICSNRQWFGYVCDNEFVVKANDEGALELETTEGDAVNPTSVTLKQGVTYRFLVESDNATVSVHESADENASPLSLPGNACGCASNGPLLITIGVALAGQSQLFLRSDVENSPPLALPIEIVAKPTGGIGEDELDSTVVEAAEAASSTAPNLGVLSHALFLTALLSVSLCLLM